MMPKEHAVPRAVKFSLKFLTVCIIAGFALTGEVASAQMLTLIGPSTNDGSFESITNKYNFTSPTSSANTIPYWGATLVNAAGGAVAAPGDSGAQIGGNVVQDGGAGAFFQPNGNSTAFNLVTTRPIAAGDQYTLTWYAYGTAGGSQVASLFSQAPSTVGATYAYTPLVTLTNFTAPLTNGPSFVQYSLTYTAQPADAGNYIGLTYGNSSPGNYSVADNFTLQVMPAANVPEPATYFWLLVGVAGLGLGLCRRAARA